MKAWSRLLTSGDSVIKCGASSLNDRGSVSSSSSYISSFMTIASVMRKLLPVRFLWMSLAMCAD